MNPFALDPLEQQNQRDSAIFNIGGFEEPGLFTGLYKAPVTGIGSAISGTALLGSDLATPATRYFFGDEAAKKQKQTALDFVKFTTPDPHTTGAVSQAVSGLFEMVPEFVGGSLATGGNPLGGAALTAAIQANKTARLAMDQGIDPLTAWEQGAFAGAFAFAAPYVPMHLSPLLTATLGVGTRTAANVVAGAGIQFAQGAANRVGMAEILRANGYEDMANQYEAFDKAGVFTDLVIGGFFGGYGGRKMASGLRPQEVIRPTDVDAALSLNSAAHIERSAPGIPTDHATQQAHIQSVEKALRDLMNDQPVDVSSTFKADSMIVDPSKTQHVDSIRVLIDDHLDTAQLERNMAETMVRQPIELPNAILGEGSAIKVGKEYLPVRWALVDAADVEATMTKADNQYRDRTRASSQAQIAEIANAPDYNLLNAAPIMDFGAPTLSRDGKVVGGNGRLAGVSQAYDQGTAGRYTEPLIQNLAKYGIDPTRADGMKKPVLVRIMETDVDVKKAAIASNEGGGLAMSDLEQAKVDAERMGSLAGLQIDTEGNFNTTANLDLIRNMVAQFPINEQGRFVDADGMLSAAGVRRVRNAVLYKAYGDSPTLARLVESQDPGAKNVANALLRTASLVAEVKDDIAAGRLYPLDISTDIASAVETLDRVRTQNLKVTDYLNQGEMFGNELTIEARKVLEFMGEYIRSSKTMGDMITTYYEGVKAAGDPAQVDMLRGEPPTKMELLDSAIAKTGKEFVPELAELPFNKAEKSAMDELPADQRKVLSDIYDKSAAAKNEFDFTGQEVAASVGGRYIDAPLKKIDRSVEKIMDDYAGDASKMKDVLRATIEVDTPAQALAVVEQLREKFTVLDSGFRNLFAPDAKTMDGYRDAKMNIEINGVVAEMQVNVPEMLKVKMEGRGHKIYREIDNMEKAAKKEGRELTPDEIKRITELRAESEKVYAEAWEAVTKRVNSSSETGVPLRNADDMGNERGSGLSQARQGGDVLGSNETGMPSTSKNSASLENFITAPENNMGADMFSAKSIVAEKPDLTIPDGNGGLVRARDALAQADENISTAERESVAFNVAAECALVE